MGLKLENGEYVVGKKENGLLVNVLSYNFVNNTYQVIGLGGDGVTHTVEGRTIELLPELMSYTDKNGNQTSIFKGSVIKSKNKLRVILDAEVDDEGNEIVYYKLIDIQDLLSECFEFDENEGFIDTLIHNLSALMSEKSEEIKIYSSLEGFKKISKEQQDLLNEIMNRESISRDIDELFDSNIFAYGIIEDIDEDIYVSVWKNELADDEYDIVHSINSTEGLENYRYKRLTVDKETLIDMLEDSSLILTEEGSDFVVDDICSCQDVFNDSWDLTDEELDELDDEDDKLFIIKQQIEFEEMISDLTGEQFDLDIIFATSPEEVYIEHMSMLEFKTYQLEMMETFLKAVDMIEFDDDDIHDMVDFLEESIKTLKILIQLMESL